MSLEVIHRRDEPAADLLERGIRPPARLVPHTLERFHGIAQQLVNDLILSPEAGIQLSDRHVRPVGYLLHARLFDSLLGEELQSRGYDLSLAAQFFALSPCNSL